MPFLFLSTALPLLPSPLPSSSHCCLILARLWYHPPPPFSFSSLAVMTGLWVLAHECGHRSFSDSEAVCNVVGSVIHSALLVPFWSWKFSHAWHHENTCSMEHDEVFVPSEREDFASSLSDDVPIASAFATAAKIFTTLVFGWCVRACLLPRLRPFLLKGGYRPAPQKFWHRETIGTLSVQRMSRLVSPRGGGLPPSHNFPPLCPLPHRPPTLPPPGPRTSPLTPRAPRSTRPPPRLARA